MILLAGQTDLIDVADAWRYNMPVGSMRPEDTDPALVGQPQAAQPPEFRREVRTPGFKLALDRIFRLGGNRGTPHGPPQNSPRLHAVRPQLDGPHRADRVVARMPAGLIPTAPAYEGFLSGNVDDFLD